MTPMEDAPGATRTPNLNISMNLSAEYIIELGGVRQLIAMAEDDVWSTVMHAQVADERLSYQMERPVMLSQSAFAYLLWRATRKRGRSEGNAI